MLAFLGWIPTGDAGIRATIEKMAGFANAAQADPLTVETAHRIVRTCRARDTRCNGLRIRAWLAGNFRFVPDSVDVETFRTPEYLLHQLAEWGYMTGDCDCAATLGAALGKAIGMPARFVVLGFPSMSDAYGHVYAELETDSGWVDLDVTKPRGPVESASRTLLYDV